MKLRTGDKVTVIAGADKGKTGKVLKVIGDTVVVEGVRVLQSAHQIAKKYNLYLPIIETAYKVLFEKLNVNEAIETILTAKLKKE